MHAYSDAAGKFNPDAVRLGNEDNFYVDDNLADEFVSRCESDVSKELCSLGLIMAVADGMGGMNAGEVASEIAVETIQEYFSPGKVTAEAAATHESRKQYLESLIVEADRRVKKDAASNPEHDGMGSTIILAWIVGNELTLSWCGDSRAYALNTKRGLQRLSKDHSYVQELVDSGELRPEYAIDHPLSNVITRCLGNEERRAEPDTRVYELYNDDIIMLCTDGLCGLCTDDVIAGVIQEQRDNPTECKNELISVALAHGGHDNVTVALARIQMDEPEATAKETPEPPALADTGQGASAEGEENKENVSDGENTDGEASAEKTNDGETTAGDTSDGEASDAEAEPVATAPADEPLNTTLRNETVKKSHWLRNLILLLLTAALLTGCYLYFFTDNPTVHQWADKLADTVRRVTQKMSH